MSNFLGRVGQITEWVVVSNLENRAVNAACDKAQGWWKDRKQKKPDSHGGAAGSTPPPSQSQIKSASPLPQYQQAQASYMPPPGPPPPPMGAGHLLITVSNVEGLNQWGPLLVIMECNHQRYQTTFGQYPQQFSFPVYQFDYDQLFIWIQTEHQQQAIAHGEIPIRFLLNDNNNWCPQQQRWIPLRDHYNGPAGQILVNVEYRAANSPAQQMAGPSPPPPYSYYP
jgi:hypothetical protein